MERQNYVKKFLLELGYLQLHMPILYTPFGM